MQIKESPSLFTYVLFLGLLSILNACSQQSNTKVSEIHYRNLDDNVAYVGMETCKTCHADIHDSFQHTGMGKSFASAHQRNSYAVFDENALVYEENSDFYYWPFVKDSLIYVKEFRLAENGDTIHQRTEKVSYIVGSGHHTNSHIIDINGYIYQAPVTYYTQDKKWDMAPSFRAQGNLRFNRLLNTECITCHNHFPNVAEGAVNKFSQMPSGIQCERCHGPGALHVSEKKAGVIVNISEEIDNSIVNPAKLSRDLQMDLCQRCHLQGTAVLEYGKSFYDFKPGMPLQDVFNVFLPRFANSDQKFIMASQADRLRQSKCFQNTEMTCLTCHDPHVSVKKMQTQHFVQACLQCHQSETQKQCSETKGNRNKVNNQCSECHMPKSGSLDIAHVRITDHKIQRKPKQEENSNDKKSFYGLEMLTKKAATNMDMARGYLALYDKYASIPYILDSVAFYLEQCAVEERDYEKTKIHYLFNRNDFLAITKMIKNGKTEHLNDAWTAYRIAEAFSKEKNDFKALVFIEKAVYLQALNLDFLEKEALILLQLSRYKAARQKFDFILSENPKRPVALCNLGYLYVLNGNLLKGETLYDQAIQLNPDYEQALLNKAAVKNLNGDKNQALQLIQRVLKINPGNLQAQQAFSLLENN